MARNADVNRKLTYEADVRKWWPFVRDGLQRVLQHSADDWIAEDVYAALVSGNALLFIGQSTEPEIAIVVNPSRSHSGPYWHVWTCAGVRHDDYLGLLERHARNAGATRITFCSPRKGWVRKGWTMKQYQYERSL